MTPLDSFKPIRHKTTIGNSDSNHEAQLESDRQAAHLKIDELFDAAANNLEQGVSGTRVHLTIVLSASKDMAIPAEAIALLRQIVFDFDLPRFELLAAANKKIFGALWQHMQKAEAIFLPELCEETGLPSINQMIKRVKEMREAFASVPMCAYQIEGNAKDGFRLIHRE